MRYRQLPLIPTNEGLAHRYVDQKTCGIMEDSYGIFKDLVDGRATVAEFCRRNDEVFPVHLRDAEIFDSLEQLRTALEREGADGIEETIEHERRHQQVGAAYGLSTRLVHTVSGSYSLAFVWYSKMKEETRNWTPERLMSFLGDTTDISDPSDSSEYDRMVLCLLGRREPTEYVRTEAGTIIPI